MTVQDDSAPMSPGPKQLNPNAQAWVDALRSGAYKQGRTRLRIGDTYCCLVACDLYRKTTGVGEWGADDAFLIGGGTYPGILPLAVTQWLGLRRRDSAFERGERQQLSALNDHGATFDRIADIIESQPEGLFAQPEGLFA